MGTDLKQGVDPSLLHMMMFDGAQAYFDLREGPSEKARTFRIEVRSLLLPALRTSVAQIDKWLEAAKTAPGAEDFALLCKVDPIVKTIFCPQ
jgi:hypothetical protein